MPPRFDQNALMRLIRDVNEIKSALRHVTTNLPLYDVANENTPASISTNQDDYSPGNYDVLRINATANVTISGIRNGKKGRFLEIINVGTGRISYTDEDANSTAANRFATPYDETVTQLPNSRVRFYYDSTQERWTLADAPNITGTYGKVAILAHSTDTIDTIPAATFQTTLPDTVLSDEWGYWDSTNKYFVVPSGENGLYSLTLQVYWYYGAATDWFSAIYLQKNGDYGVGTTIAIPHNGIYNASTGYAQYVNVTNIFQLNAGDTLKIQVYQDNVPHADRYFNRVQAGMPVYTFLKIG